MINELSEIITTNPELLDWIRAQLFIEFKTAVAITAILMGVTAIMVVIAWSVRETVEFDGRAMLLIVPAVASAISGAITIHLYYQLQNPEFAIITILINVLN